MEGLNLNNILSGDEVDTLFDKYTESDDNTVEDNQDNEEVVEEPTEKNND